MPILETIMGAATAANALKGIFGSKASGDAKSTPVPNAADGMGDFMKNIGTAAEGFSPMITSLQKKKTPNPITGKDAGSYQKDYMDAAYPGSSVWDRLGGNTGSPQTPMNSEGALKQTERLKNKELETEKEVAKIHARAQIITGTSGVLSPDETNKQLQALDTGIRQDISSNMYQLLEREKGQEFNKLSEDIKKVIADTANALAQNQGYQNASDASRYEMYIKQLELEKSKLEKTILANEEKYSEETQKERLEQLKTENWIKKRDLFWQPVKDVIGFATAKSGLGQVTEALGKIKGDVKDIKQNPITPKKTNPNAFPYKGQKNASRKINDKGEYIPY